MAHIQTKGGRYVVRHRGPDGRERSKSFDLLRDARAYRAGIESAQSAGAYIDPKAGTITLEVYAERWMSSRIDLRDTTRATQESVLRSLVLPTLGGYRIDRITPDDLRSWIAQMHHDGMAPATIRKALTIVRKILARAVIDRRIGANPADVEDLNAPSVRQKSMQVLTPDEIGQLVEAAGPFYSTHLYTAAATGLRWGELAGLEPENLDVLRGEIRVVSQLREVAGVLTLGVPPKTSASSRVVTIPRTVADRIGEHMGRFPNDEGVVFSTLEGRLLRRSNFGARVMKPAAAAIGRPDLTFHDLRHTHASLLLGDGEPITNVAARLGHRDAAITLRVYAHVLEGTERSAADRFEAILAGYSRDKHPLEGRPGNVETLGAQPITGV